MTGHIFPNPIRPLKITPHNPKYEDLRREWEGTGFGNAHRVRQEHDAETAIIHRQAEKTFGKRKPNNA